MRRGEATGGAAALVCQAVSEDEVLRAREELRRRFLGIGGCMARSTSFARLLTAFPPASVEEALHRLWEEGAVEMHCLSDGSLAFHFPPA
jgi:hypothetical protein